uniref:Uncharacterized protein n=1 Tax=Lepeophtheirus salmonis TaxID=72036 RepID=A0A0K2T0N8_LEPSM
MDSNLVMMGATWIQLKNHIYWPQAKLTTLNLQNDPDASNCFVRVEGWQLLKSDSYPYLVT